MNWLFIFTLLLIDWSRTSEQFDRPAALSSEYNDLLVADSDKLHAVALTSTSDKMYVFWPGENQPFPGTVLSIADGDLTKFHVNYNYGNNKCSTLTQKSGSMPQTQLSLLIWLSSAAIKARTFAPSTPSLGINRSCDFNQREFLPKHYNEHTPLKKRPSSRQY